MGKLYPCQTTFLKIIVLGEEIMLGIKQSAMVDAESKSNITISPYFLIRVAGLSTKSLKDMRIDSTMEFIEKRDILKQYLFELTPQLINLIEKQVPLLVSDEKRKYLINYKRDVFNGRKPRVSIDALTDVLPHSLLQLMKRWEESHEKMEDLYRIAESAFEQELFKSREILQKVVSHKNFLQGIALSSQDLFSKLLKYIKTPIEQHNARLRKVEYSISSFLSRTILKTSPFSTFTSVGFGFWEEEGNSEFEINNIESKGFIQINYANVLRVVDALSNDPDIRKLMNFKINSSLVVSDGKIRLLRRIDSSTHRARVHKTLESVLSFNSNPTIETMLGIYKENQNHSINFESLKQRINSKTNIALESIEKFIEKLIEIQVLEVDLPFYQQDPDLMDSVLKLLDHFSTPVAKFVQEQLYKIQSLLNSYLKASVHERGSILGQMKNIFENIFRALKTNIPEESLKMLVYEDEILPNFGTMSKQKWNEYLANLAAYQSISPLFDIKFRLQSEIADKFIEMYGEDGICDNSNEFLSELSKIFTKYNRSLLPTEILADLEIQSENQNIKDLISLKKEFGMTLAKRMQEEDEVILTPEEMEHFCQRIPKAIRKRPISHDCFVQLGNKSGLLTVNSMFVGFATFFSRFLKYVEGTEYLKQVFKQLKDIFPDQAVAEQASVFGFNANLHPEIVPYDLHVPTLGMSRSDKGNIHIINWDDITIVYDKELDRVALEHPELGRVNVLYAATLTPRLLPFLVGAIVTLFTNGSVQNNLFMFGEALLLEEKRKEVRNYPRVRVGNIIISRKKWVIPRSKLLGHVENESDFQLFHRMHEWRKALGIPNRMFFRFFPENDNENPWLKVSGIVPNETSTPIDLTDFKPQFVDFENPLFVKFFEKRVNTVPMGIVVEEMVPDLDDLILHGPDGPVVTEFLIELNRIPMEEI